MDAPLQTRGGIAATLVIGHGAGARRPHPAAYSLLPENGQTWIGTRDGVELYRDGRVQRPRMLEAMDAAQVNGIVRDRQGRLWFATSTGLYRWDGGDRLRRY